jgi:hypothetical protein
MHLNTKKISIPAHGRPKRTYQDTLPDKAETTGRSYWSWSGTFIQYRPRANATMSNHVLSDGLPAANVACIYFSMSLNFDAGGGGKVRG